MPIFIAVIGVIRLGGHRMKVFAACVAVLLASAAGYAVAQDLKIGYVNPFRIQQESVTAQRALESLKKEFAPREQELSDLGKRVTDIKNDLDKNASTMQPDEQQSKEKNFNDLARQFQQMQQNLNEDLEARKREEYEHVVSEANVVIKEIAEAGKYDLIVQDAVFSSQQTDLTDQVLSEMAKRIDTKGNAGK
jgi:outer membrane protein